MTVNKREQGAVLSGAFAMRLTRRICILLSLVVWGLLIPSSEGLKHSFAVRRDSRLLIAPIGAPFGFTQGGCFGLDVFDFTLTMSMGVKRKGVPQQGLDQVEAGLLLKRFKSESAFATYHEEIMSNASSCIFDPFRSTEEDFFDGDDDDIGEVSDITSAGTDGIYIPLKSRPTTDKASIMYQFQQGEEGLYFLMYQVCAKDSSELHAKIRSTFELDFHYRNYDFLGNENYLSAGETKLPHVFLYFSISYGLLLAVWMTNIRRIQRGEYDGAPGGRPIIHPIHQLMSVLLILKTLSIFFESVRYHFIRVSGHAELWSVVYYFFAFLKGTFLFTVILLIGSGWSFVKPFLSDREKKVICLVLTLQVLDNIALVALSQESEGERAYEDWSAVLHLVDILCCCAVLVPIVWQVNSLEKSLEGPDSESGETSPPSTVDDMRTLSKLKLFRSFYLMVVAYIYFTRILVYLFATLLDYRHTWIRYLMVELVTLLFYVVTGLRFRPMNDNPYLTVNKDESTRPMMEPEHEIEFGTVDGEGSSKGS